MEVYSKELLTPSNAVKNSVFIRREDSCSFSLRVVSSESISSKSNKNKANKIRKELM